MKSYIFGTNFITFSLYIPKRILPAASAQSAELPNTVPGLAFCRRPVHCGTATIMHRSARLLNGVCCALIALPFAFSIHSDALPHVSSSLAALPRITLWAWERREDLHAIDTKQFAVAYLYRTITIGETVRTQPRRDALFLPASASRIPVVRIEAAVGATLTAEHRRAVVDELLSASGEPGISALQVDFDATRSQRDFYRDLLIELRKEMPANLPLSITALASWCSQDDWLRGLPIDEAVPMLFRMEPDRRRASPNLDEFQIREPLCRTSAGLSTDEPWPADLAHKRIYIFPDHGWRADSPAEIVRRLP